MGTFLQLELSVGLLELPGPCHRENIKDRMAYAQALKLKQVICIIILIILNIVIVISL
jgi:hypothetical protein